jgi:uncharacterized damage-inducible protein DinB
MQMSAEQAQILQKVALATLEHEAKTTQRVILAIPPDNANYKPDEVSMSSLELAKHIAISELQIIRGAINGSFDFSEQVPDSVKTPSDVATWYAGEVEKVAAQLKVLPPEKVSQVIDFRGFMQMPAVLFVNLAIHHSIHHRGQLSAHLRAAGGKVPSIYGPSYEDQQAQKAASASN